MSGVQPGDSLTYTAYLPQERNHIRVLVENQWAENGDETWVENPQWQEQGQPKGTLYVNAIGVSQYPNLGKDLYLRSPPLDAKNIARQMEGMVDKLYDKVVVTLLVDNFAGANPITTSNIETLLSEQAARAGPRDTSIIFLAGHGITDKGNYQFITADTVFPDLKTLKPILGTSFNWAKLHKILDNTRGRRLVFVDTCQADKVLNVIQPDMSKLVKDIHDVNAIIYTGTSWQEPGYEDKKGGVFTQAILDGMKGRAEYRSENLLFTDLRKYVDSEVPKLNIRIQKEKEKRRIKEMEGRGLLVKEIKEEVEELNKIFASTQHPVAVVPKGMKDLIISRR